MQKTYWQFYWPLTLTGLAVLVAKQFENGVLARYPHAAEQLAVFAYGWSCYMLFGAALIFVPQTVTRLARNTAGRAVCYRFVMTVCLALTGLLAFVSFTPPGTRFVGMVFDVNPAQLKQVVTYLRWLTPLVLVNGSGLYLVGLLVLRRRTGMVTLIQVVYLVSTVTILISGLTLGWPPLVTMVTSQTVGALVKLLMGLMWWFKIRGNTEADTDVTVEPVTFGSVFSFFWPVALTSFMFAISRPILYSFLSRTTDAVITVAALRVSFDLAMLFHNPVNQSRHLFVTFGMDDRRGMQIFLTRVMLGLSLLMLAFAASPAITFVTGRALGVAPDIALKVRQAFWPLAFVPVAIMIRNMIHGTALVKKKTTGMGVGGVARNIVVYAMGAILWRINLLNHITASIILVAGFFAEGVVTLAWLRIVDKVRGPVFRADVRGALGMRILTVES